jgi:hypothetical protein
VNQFDTGLAPWPSAALRHRRAQGLHGDLGMETALERAAQTGQPPPRSPFKVECAVGRLKLVEASTST